MGNLPGLGSETVPLKEPPDVIVPRNSISPPVDAARKRSVKPLLRVTKLPALIGRTAVVGGFCQELVALATVPSESTSRCTVNSCPSASDPLAQAGVVEGCRVKDQFPVASA
jgi:hypothetical protein